LKKSANYRSGQTTVASTAAHAGNAAGKKTSALNYFNYSTLISISVISIVFVRIHNRHITTYLVIPLDISKVKKNHRNSSVITLSDIQLLFQHLKQTRIRFKKKLKKNRNELVKLIEIKRKKIIRGKKTEKKRKKMAEKFKRKPINKSKTALVIILLNDVNDRKCGITVDIYSSSDVSCTDTGENNCSNVKRLTCCLVRLRTMCGRLSLLLYIRSFLAIRVLRDAHQCHERHGTNVECQT